MSLFHAVVFVDHHFAELLQFAGEHMVEQRVHEHRHFTRKQGNGERAEHVFFAQVCDALDGIAEVMVVGGHTGLANFKHYVDEHRPLTAVRVTGYEVVDHPSANQLVSMARKHFFKYEQMAGIPVPTGRKAQRHL